MSAYRCDGCPATFEHPDVEECASVEGGCEHLMRAGWRQAYLRIFFGKSERLKPWGTHILSRGGWICPDCVKRYTPERGRSTQ